MSDDQGDVEQQLRAALDHRTDIGMAMGILMERFGIAEEDAFALLRRASQRENRKLFLLAAEIVRTRELPASLSTGEGAGSG